MYTYHLDVHFQCSINVFVNYTSVNLKNKTEKNPLNQEKTLKTKQ